MKEQYGIGQSMTTGILSCLLLFFITGLFSSQNPLVSKQEEPTSVLQTPQQVTLHFADEIGWDSQREVSLLRSDGEVETMSLSDYLWGVLAAEMPASFPLEALKAQAVAARTYTLLRLENPTEKHGLAQICDDSACCQAYMDRETRLDSWGEQGDYYEDILTQAVAETGGLCVLYDGYPIDAVFFSSASGSTLDAQAVWGTQVPYLVGVESPEGEGVPNYYSEVTFRKEELQLLLASRYPSISLEEDSSQWFKDPVFLEGGSVGQYTVGGVTLTGAQIRSALGLRSSSFHLTVGEVFTFSVTGYGHGVGLSQYGAKALAEEGKNVEEILTWYYTGTTVDVYGVEEEGVS